MRKRVVAKGNLRRGDHMRAVVTDTLPEEVPIVFSNDGFYLNTSSGLRLGGPEAELAQAILDGSDSYTVPYRYRVLRDRVTTRGLSLLHPAAQMKVAVFYKKYDALICYYARKSPFSLRSPQKVGSTFFIKSVDSGLNRYRGQSIDTVSIEKGVSNPASYFSYNKFNRAHQFFDSMDYIHLEKKFEVFRTLDIAKCFNSIYTHTLSWAVTNIKLSKDNTSAVTFGNDFDKLMQSGNYNETNGICIGPEVSRVFAEIILSDADKAIVEALANGGLTVRSDYDIRRYVDDYYVFARSDAVASRVTAQVEAALSKFNLHLNHEKTVTIVRPFSTRLSEAIASVNRSLVSFFDQFIEYRANDDDRFATPKTIRRSDALLRNFVVSVKTACVAHDASYEAISDYVISALSKRVVELTDGHRIATAHGSREDDYVAALMLLIEASYFFYTVNPTVRSSLNIARSLVTTGKLFRDHLPSRTPFLSESIVRWTLELSRSMHNGTRHKDLTAVPVEVLNVVLPMREIAENEPLIDSLVGVMCEQVQDFEYFEIVTLLYLIGGRPAHRKLTAKLFGRAKEIVRAGYGPKVDSQSAHLCLDLLSCPYLALDKRGGWFNSLRSRCGLPKIPAAAAQAAAKRMEAHPWFVRWEGVDLLSILRKKELSPVY
ncbi:MAG: RNA-directed DNA polymerase [Cytophagaceae bacterium]|nr:MAG: RNA-directed DNA polymerase [Cytophagaceae bacterium]